MATAPFVATHVFQVGRADGDPPNTRDITKAKGFPADRFPFDGSIFPFGAIHYSTLPHWQHYLQPISEWRPWLERDLRQMKDVGLNTVVAHLDWYDIEPAPGQYDFIRSDVVVELAEKLGLYALLWPWPELEPEWLPRVYPDSLWVADDGMAPGSSCWDHPQVREAVGSFMKVVIERYRSSRAVLGWDVAAEPGLWISGMSLIRERSVARTYCYCAHTKRRYRSWLEKRYGNLANLNQWWGTYFRDWHEVEPLRTGIFERAQSVWLDWREFMLWNLADFQAFKSAAAREADSTRPITCHIGSWGTGYVFHCADEYQISQFVDVFGLSLFPYWIQRGAGWYEASLGALKLDGIRSSGRGKPMWVEELQGGPSVFGMSYYSQTPQASDIRLWVWQSVAHGAKGIYFWNWRPELTGIEASGFGLVHTDGSLTPRAKEAGEISKILQKYSQRFAATRTWPAEIAILHSPRTSILAFAEQDEALPARSLQGLYRALWRQQFPVDFLVPEQLTDGTDLHRYKIIFLPLAYTLSSQEADALREFVADGGTLFADLWCARKDEKAMIYEQAPGGGLHEVFGCHEIELVPMESSTVVLTNPGAVGSSLPSRTALAVRRYLQLMAPHEGCEVAAEFEDGSPALLVNRYGKGTAIYAPALLCRAFDETTDENLAKFFADVALHSGVQPPVRLEREPTTALVEVRVLTGSAEDTVIVLNHSDSPVSCGLSFPHPRHRGGAFVDLLSGEPIEANQMQNSRSLSVSLRAKDVRVWSLRSQQG